MLGFGPPANRQARCEWWRRQIQRQKDSRLSVAEFCRRLGVSTVTFYAWKRRFREAPAASQPVSGKRLFRSNLLSAHLVFNFSEFRQSAGSVVVIPGMGIRPPWGILGI